MNSKKASGDKDLFEVLNCARHREVERNDDFKAGETLDCDEDFLSANLSASTSKKSNK